MSGASASECCAAAGRAGPASRVSLRHVEHRTRYADNDGVSIAYQVIGDGPIDLVFVPGFVSDVEQIWDVPILPGMLERLASFSRLIIYDKRGTGRSDPVTSVPTVEERMEDMRAVMDAAESERACFFGVSEGGPMALTFAATYPDRTVALALFGTSPRFSAAPDWEWGFTSEQLDESMRRIKESWGEGALIEGFAPTGRNDQEVLEAWNRMARAGASPGMARALLDALRELDVRAVLPSVRVPTTIISRRGDRLAPIAAARYMAEKIPGARLVELEGSDHTFFAGDRDAILDEVEELVTGSRGAGSPDRILATVLFTDIVGSTERAAEMGDKRWRELLTQHDTAVRRQIDRFRGRAVKSTGDGILATFDGPARAIQCARAIHGAVEPLGVEVRAGLHTGECEVIGDDVAGMAVHIGARVGAEAEAGEVLVSGTVKDLVVGSGLEFEDRGARELKGVPGEWRLYSVAG